LQSIQNKEVIVRFFGEHPFRIIGLVLTCWGSIAKVLVLNDLYVKS